MSTWSSRIKKDPAGTIGWLIFAIMLIALLAGYYVFNPFLFGFAYYVIYVLLNWRNTKDENDPELLSRRLLSVSIISLVYLWSALNNEIDKRQFTRHFEKTCNQSQYSGIAATDRLCDDIQSHINSYLYKERDHDDE